jgi:hypothetical protein
MFQCTSCGRIVDVPHTCKEADEAEVEIVRASLAKCLLRHDVALSYAESTAIAKAIDELIQKRLDLVILRRC